MFLIVGLGNPGSEYSLTRHNIGYELVDHLAKAEGLVFKRGFGLVSKVAKSRNECVLAKPLTYMNLSGKAVRKLLNKFNVDPRRLVVVCDDVDLPAGQLRLRLKGSPGGHNGLQSVATAIGTQDFARLRMGVGPRPSGEDLVEYVLGKWPEEELDKRQHMLEKGVELIRYGLQSGFDAAMNKFN